MPLTHYALLNAQPRAKTYKLFDGHGLYLQVAPSGGKWWRVKYRLRGREQCLSLGTFPAVALKAARQRCEELRAKLASGVDPAAERRLAKQQLRMKDESFEVIAREWYAAFSPELGAHRTGIEFSAAWRLTCSHGSAKCRSGRSRP